MSNDKPRFHSEDAYQYGVDVPPRGPPIKYKSKLLADIKKKDRDERNKNELLLAEKKKKKDKASTYAKYVKEMY